MIGGKWLTEINVTSPTGIVAIDKFNGTDTPALIWDAIEARLAAARRPERMSDWVVRLIEQSGYLGVGFLMFLETIFPPIPSEVIMPVAGVAAAKGKMAFWLVVACGTAGAMLGNIVWYLAARALGVDRLEPIIDRHGTLADHHLAGGRSAPSAGSAEHGMFFVFIGRLLPTVRSLVSVPAGLLRDALPKTSSSPRRSAPPAGRPSLPAPATSSRRMSATSRR